MRTTETWVLTYLLNAVWQVPLLFSAAWIATRAVRRSGPAAEHRIWTLTLWLETLLPACSLNPASLLHSLLSSFAAKSSQRDTTITVTVGAGSVRAGLHIPPLMLHSMALLYAAVVLFFAARLTVAAYRTMRLRNSAKPLILSGEAQTSFARMARAFGIDSVMVASAASAHGPLVLGARHPLLLLPDTMLPQTLSSESSSEDFEAALAHEFAHVQRHDFAKNLLYELLSLPIAFHPLRWHTRTRVAETRELLCDAMAAGAVNGRQRYARSLLRLASNFSERTRSNTLHAIGLFDANSFKNFERRVMNLTQRPMKMNTARRIAVTALAVVVGFGACTSALALRMQVATPVQQQTASAPVTLTIPRSGTGAPVQMFVADITPATGSGTSASSGASSASGTSTASGVSAAPARVRILTPTTSPVDSTVTDTQTPTATQDVRLPVSGDIVAGNIESKVTPVYPAEAKEKHIEGAVVLHAVIGKDGSISSLALVSGTEELAHSAIDAVKQWKYKPYLLNGNPTEVDTNITVTYSLNK